jgi:hypothetical protein
MTKKTTRKQHSTENRNVLYLAFELSEITWKLGFTIGLSQRVREGNKGPGI